MAMIDADKLYLKLLDMEFPIQDQDPIIDAMDDCIIDDVPVVRCKDCIHYGDDGDCEVHPYDGRFNVNYFCADGEKKD